MYFERRRGGQEDERRSGQSLSKRAKNLLLLRRRGLDYFSRRTTYLTKLNVFFFFTPPREKKVRRYLKRGCLPGAFLSFSFSCGEKWRRLRNESGEKGKRGGNVEGPPRRLALRILRVIFVGGVIKKIREKIVVS